MTDLDSTLRPACDAGLSAVISVAGERFATTLLDLHDDSVIIDAVRPAHGARHLRVGAEVTVEYLFGGAPHEFRTTVQGAEDGEIVLARPPEVARRQRRRWFRVPAEDGINVTLRMGGGSLSRPLLDVSAGGVCFRSEPGDPLPARSEVIVQLPLSAGDAFVATGIVRYVSERDSATGTERVAGVEFDELPTRDRERLAAWVTERERHLSQRRRAFRRVAAAEGIVVLHGPENRVRLRVASDVSIGGVSFLAVHDDVDLVPGAHFVRTELRLPGAQPFFLSGDVKNRATVGEPLCALEFRRVPNAEVVRLARALDRFQPAVARLVK